ncbi:hypothetical protein [Acinetobacter sp. UBA6720]|uniref:hypothetical protein n=1 Tax=Acinetobacter sp. UBA6720 TaxID=1945953 RepID=UPI0025BBA834|nr:hypothetical protein [Acinetobacter sp. UBA6720]
MNIKFVAVGLVIIGVLFGGTELYWKKQFEQQARDHFKNISFVQSVNEAMARTNLPLQVDALNQYPHTLVYVNLTQNLPASVDQADLMTQMEKLHHQMSCGYFDYLQQKEAEDKHKDFGKAVVTVVEEDQLAISYILKNKQGKVWYEQKQILSQCPEFIELKQSIT